MSPGFHSRSFAPVSGLGGVRALAGLGCGCASNPSQPASGVGTVMDVVKSPLGIGIIALVALVGYVLVREAIR